MGQTTLLIGLKLRSRSEDTLRINGIDEPGSVAFKEPFIPDWQIERPVVLPLQLLGRPPAVSDGITHSAKATVIQVRKALLTASRFCRSTLGPSALGQSVGG